MSSGIIGPDPVNSQVTDTTRTYLAEQTLKQIEEALDKGDREAATKLIKHILKWCDPVFLAAFDTVYDMKRGK